jgi:HlyD family secretion protein
VPLDQLLLAKQTERVRESLELRRNLLQRLEGLEVPNAVSQVELIRERLNVKQTESDLARCESAKALVDGEFAAARLAEAEARVANAKAAIVSLAADRKRIDSEIERRLIRAPNDGLVVSRSVRFPGERAEAGNALFKLARGEQVRIRLYASEDRVTRIKSGMLVRFRTKADPDRLTPSSIGRVTDVALDRLLTRDDGISNSNRGGYAIDVDVEAATTALPLGAAIDAEIVLDQRPFWRLLLLKHEAPAANADGAK